MTTKEAIQILEAHNKWRRDNSFMPEPQTDPTTLGEAIDRIVDWYRQKEYLQYLTQESHNEKEPPPTIGRIDVTKEVLKDIAERSKMGQVKYGTPLMTHNGRKPLIDAYQEVLDLAVYLKQELLERSENADKL